MQRIGVRELRQNASRYLRDVERGETVEITDHGRPVAHLVPVARGGAIVRLQHAGRLTLGDHKSLLELVALEPIDNIALPSQVLDADRADER